MRRRIVVIAFVSLLSLTTGFGCSHAGGDVASNDTVHASGSNSASGSAGSGGNSGVAGASSASGAGSSNAHGGTSQDIDASDAGEGGVSGAGAAGTGLTYSDYAARAVSTLIANYYNGDGRWKECTHGCSPQNSDHGAGSSTFTLYLRWLANGHDSSIAPYMSAIMNASPSYGGPCATANGCGSWSDVPMWDTIANLREYEVTGNNGQALTKGKAAFKAVDGAGQGVYAGGACPSVLWQQAGGGGNKLKTLETDSNYIKAALLLYQATNDATYLDKAKTRYTAVRQYFLDPTGTGLYTVYVFDDGTKCVQALAHYYASVNGNMIWNGLRLSTFTGVGSYLADAMATANAVVTELSDANGIFADLQAENDIVVPLIEAMYDVATEQNQAFARDWILRNASAAVSAIKPSTGSYGRFFDGPPPVGTITEYMTNGGFSLLIAAGALDPTGVPATTDAWTSATSKSIDITTSSLPAPIMFTGTGIALIGTVGEQCCELGHAAVLIDGAETNDQTGIWQDKSNSGQTIADSVLFAWRWQTAGTHTITIIPALSNAKEGDTFVHVQQYWVKP